MGTSTDHAGGSGGGWEGAKRASTSFAKKGDRRRAERALAKLVVALGGAAAVVAASGAAISGAQRLAGVAGAAATDGLDAALRGVGLDNLVGSSPDEVVAALVDLLAGGGEDRESQAARSAACDVFDELAEDADSYEDLAAALSDADAVGAIVEQFLAAYVYWLLLPIIEERMNRLDDPELRARRDRELREVVRAVVELNIARGGFDSTSEVTDEQVRALLEETFGYLEEQDF